jgi:uncharacterized protein (UPF0332 family)
VPPQAARFLEKAQKLLAEAEIMLSVGLNDAAGRTAHLVGFHAAQAFLFERSGRLLESHKGVQTEFLRLTKDDAHAGAEFRAFLPRAYNLKSIADYETGPGSEVSAETAAQTAAAAKQFVARIGQLLPDAASPGKDGGPRL